MEDPTIKLNGKEYAIPKLAIKQNRHVELLVVKNREYFAQVARIRAARMAKLKDPSLPDVDMNILDLTEDQVEDFTKIVYYALTRANPTLKYEDFENWPLSVTDIVVALPVCVMQTGLFSKPAAEPAPPTGEAQPPSTGTESSQS